MDLYRNGRTPQQLAREFEPSAPTIREWCQQADRDAGGGDGGATSAEREELARLHRPIEPKDANGMDRRLPSTIGDR